MPPKPKNIPIELTPVKRFPIERSIHEFGDGEFEVILSPEFHKPFLTGGSFDGTSFGEERLWQFYVEWRDSHFPVVHWRNPNDDREIFYPVNFANRNLTQMEMRRRLADSTLELVSK